MEQHFIGVKGKEGSQQSRKNLDRVTFKKVSELVGQGHQVMVFVHARKETVKTALALKESALADGIIEDFSCEDHPSFQLFRKNIGESRNKEMRQLFDDGFGIHHAGMLRTDRNMMERMFEARAIKVSVTHCTLHSSQPSRFFVVLLLWHGVSIFRPTQVSLSAIFNNCVYNSS